MKQMKHKENWLVVTGTGAGTAGTAKPKITALEYLQSIYRNPMEATPVRIRAATEALPHESPRMTAVSVGYFDGNTFAQRLDRAIEASDRAKVANPKVIEHRVIEETAAETDEEG